MKVTWLITDSRCKVATATLRSLVTSLALIFLVVVVVVVADDVDTSSSTTTPAPATSTASSVKRLQIGVKKRVENCLIKSKKGDLLHIHYKGTLAEDGTEFDSSYGRDQPLTFTLGASQVIKGWEQGLLGMCEGEKRKLVIPPELGYGTAGAPPKIPGNAVLIFETELVRIERRNGEL